MSGSARVAPPPAEARLRLDPTLYPEEAVAGAAQALGRQAAVCFEQTGDGWLEVSLRLLPEARPRARKPWSAEESRQEEEDRLRVLVAALRNELVHQVVRLDLARELHGLREIVLGRAMLAAEGKTPQDVLAEAASTGPRLQGSAGGRTAESTSWSAAESVPAADPLGIAQPWQEEDGRCPARPPEDGGEAGDEDALEPWAGRARMPFVRLRSLGDRRLLTNDAGRWQVLAADELDAYLAGRLDPGSALYGALVERGMIRSPGYLDPLADRLRRRCDFLSCGPSLHVVVVTLRCDHACAYCHASRAPLATSEYDMSEATARRVVEQIFETTSPGVTIELQGGEPLLNFGTVRAILEHAGEQAARSGKHVDFSLVSSLSPMNDQMLDLLLDHGVRICTSIDGPADLHDGLRPLVPGTQPSPDLACAPATQRTPPTPGSSHAVTVAWLGRIRQALARRGASPEGCRSPVQALLTVTRQTLPRLREVVDEYIALGLDTIHLRPLAPFGLARHAWAGLGCRAGEFLDAYRDALDYIIERNRQGVFLRERRAALHLQKILGDRDPNYMEMRSPCGAGLGQLAWNHDGNVYSCDEGRMLGRMGDAAFCLGHVARTPYAGLVGHETVRSLAVASFLDALPACNQCAYAPFCGVCPVYNYAEQGDIFGKMPGSDWCRMSMGILDALFARLDGADADLTRIFGGWIAGAGTAAVGDRAGCPVCASRGEG
jgi:radical SAM protein with 4Fe4S-binding SPASM domain